MQQCGFVHVRAHYVQGTLSIKLASFDAPIFPVTVLISTLSASVPSLTPRLSRPECLLYLSATSETHGGFKHVLTASIKTVGAGKHTQRAAGLMYAHTHRTTPLLTEGEQLCRVCGDTRDTRLRRNADDNITRH